MVMIRKATPTKSTTSSGTSNGKSSMWTDVSGEITRRVVHMQLYGETGTGRTSVALSAPGPIALMHADEKIDGIVEPFVRDGKKVRTYNFGGTFSGSTEQIASQANEAMKDFYRAWADAFTWARTVILDTHTELWELLRLARFGKLAQVKPIHYGPVNAEWQSIFKMFRRQDKANLICIGKIREKYDKNDKPTGKMEQAGQKDFGYLSDIRIRMDKSITKSGVEFSGMIEKAWFNAQMEGTELPEAMLTFPEILETITEIPSTEWE